MTATAVPPIRAPLRRAHPFVACAGVVLRRLGLMLGLLVVVFVGMSLLPGDAARAVLGRDATAAQLAAKRHELGLDRPLADQFLHLLRGLVTGDLGKTARGTSVSQILATTLPNTLVLGVLATVVTVVLSVVCGVGWVLRPRGVIARVLSPVTAMGIAIPEFVVGTFLVLIFSLQLAWFPAVTVADTAGRPASLSMYILPVLALALPQAGWNTRVVRAALADTRSAPHAEAALLDGLSPWHVMLRHVLPLAAPTIASSIATTTCMLLGGAIVVETIFNYPGIGSVLAASVADRDTVLVTCVVLFTGAVITAALLLSDLVRAWSTRGRA